MEWKKTPPGECPKAEVGGHGDEEGQPELPAQGGAGKASRGCAQRL